MMHFPLETQKNFVFGMLDRLSWHSHSIRRNYNPSEQLVQEVSFLGAATTEETPRGVMISKAILALSFVLPYVVDWVNAEDSSLLAIYAPTWVALESAWTSYIGPTPMSLLMFVYWTPYVYVAYQSYRFAHGKYSSVMRYVLGVVFVTSLAMLLVVPFAMVPQVSTGDTDYYPLVVPLPLISILAISLIPVLRPMEVSSPWNQTNRSNQD